MSLLAVPTEDSDGESVLWRYMRLRHVIGSYCFGWRYDNEIIPFSYEHPARHEYAGGDA